MVTTRRLAGRILTDLLDSGTYVVRAGLPGIHLETGVSVIVIHADLRPEAGGWDEMSGGTPLAGPPERTG